MIYTKASNFSYPVLNNIQDDYVNKHFNISIDTKYKDGSFYQFKISTDINSEFLLNQIKLKKAKLFLIVSSIDSRFYEFDSENPIVKISDTRVCLKENTRFQAIIMSTSVISFKDNEDLHPFYDSYKSELKVGAGRLLAFSNDYIFTGDIEKAAQIFKQKIDPNLQFPFKIELDRENIIIKYKNNDTKFSSSINSRNLNNMYLYIGLERALLNLIDKNLESEYMDGLGSLEDGIKIETISNGSPLDMKLKNLLLDKGFERIYLDNIDDAVQNIAEDIVQKFVEAVNKENE